jgi:alkanesulfonate monooxygenase SsuD/methylene tetrahydromethanopterin reductase-like flavin-dependent oxidoreductase (luciferase family)
MDVGVALPQMAPGLDRDRFLAWCRAIDEGPFSSISAGERITFDNLDGFTLLAAAAAATERVRILFNVVVAPWHRIPLLAKELASTDVLSGGRVEVAVGVGGREQDYAALDSPFEGRFGRLDRAVDELRRLWLGEDLVDGAGVGPRPVQAGGPPILSSGTGPRSLARAAHWADGVTGFTIGADVAEAGEVFRLADEAWTAAGRTDRPRRLTGSFVALGPDARDTLVAFGERYLAVFGERAAVGLSRRMPLHTDEALAEFLTGLAAAGCDEVILVPASSDPALVERLAEVVSSLS